MFFFFSPLSFVNQMSSVFPGILNDAAPSTPIETKDNQSINMVSVYNKKQTLSLLTTLKPVFLLKIDQKYISLFNS